MEHGRHLIFIADEVGIATIFPSLKSKIAEKYYKHISLLYYSEVGQYLFQKEIEILKSHYPTKFFGEMMRYDLLGDWNAEKEEIEAIINANTMPNLAFVVCGKTEFQNQIQHILQFLGITHISTQDLSFS
ncbi:hypothetical protein SAMN05421780_104200 [Flexibacter flexilis DSM 6793]|uniref:Oxidoreductase FAD/NAD(P)-binding domain-containing protein n=1 Tax=Flexibacter flexilis DSM 6793 TaxID=927664 RepID=A0A1I1I3T1_9BACT|nr:hypothetical protein [Flexibacter flexilis]SFC30967.1 hypothetical protein SAMN05421780_104200 [Flexibacter flexilis DSM 6793]